MDKVDSRNEHVQFGGREDHLLCIRIANRSMECSNLESLHPNDQSATLKPQQLHAIATPVEKQKEPSFTNVFLKVGRNDAVKAIVALTHVDGPCVHEDTDVRTKSDHLRALRLEQTFDDRDYEPVMLDRHLNARSRTERDLHRT